MYNYYYFTLITVKLTVINSHNENENFFRRQFCQQPSSYMCINFIWSFKIGQAVKFEAFEWFGYIIIYVFRMNMHIPRSRNFLVTVLPGNHSAYVTWSSTIQGEVGALWGEGGFHFLCRIIVLYYFTMLEVWTSRCIHVLLQVLDRRDALCWPPLCSMAWHVPLSGFTGFSSKGSTVNICSSLSNAVS